MATTERLIVKEGTPPATADGAMGCVMLVVTGKNADKQWFEYKTSYLPPAPIFCVEWEPETMNAVLPAETAAWLIRNNYARSMETSEARAYNKGLEKTEKPKTQDEDRKESET